MGNVAASVRIRKEKNPKTFCADPKCLWNTRNGTKPCPKHPAIDWEQIEADAAAMAVDFAEDGL